MGGPSHGFFPCWREKKPMLCWFRSYQWIQLWSSTPERDEKRLWGVTSGAALHLVKVGPPDRQRFRLETDSARGRKGSLCVLASPGPLDHARVCR
jgi:hypothetical protein